MATDHPDTIPLTKTVELENRIGRLEAAVREMRDKLESVGRLQIATQAQLDHIAARLAGF